VGQAIGAGHRDTAPRIVRVTLLAATAWQVCIGLAYWLGGRQLLSPFVADDAAAKALLDCGAIMLPLSAFWTAFDVAAATYSESLSAAGDTAVTLRVRVALFACVFIPGAWVLTQRLSTGWMILVLWYAACSALVAAVLHVRFRRGAWRNIQLTGDVTCELPRTAVA
jgi:Na+-driven multidrug efflux pump